MMNRLLALSSQGTAAQRFYATFSRWNALHDQAAAKAPATFGTRHRIESPATLCEHVSRRHRLASTLAEGSRKGKKPTKQSPKATAGAKDDDTTTSQRKLNSSEDESTTATTGMQEDAGANSRAVRQVMRIVPYPVVLITSMAKSTDGKPQVTYSERKLPFSSSFRGMSVSSFNTVCLEPAPIISFNIRQPSKTYEALLHRRDFTIHILNDSLSGATLADAFTRGQSEQTFERLESLGYSWTYTPTENIGPVFTGQAIKATLTCQLFDERLDVGDHAVVFARVTKVSDIGSLDSSEGSLIYSNQRYRTASQKSIPHEISERVIPPKSSTETSDSLEPKSLHDLLNPRVAPEIIQQIRSNANTLPRRYALTEILCAADACFESPPANRYKGTSTADGILHSIGLDRELMNEQLIQALPKLQALYSNLVIDRLHRDKSRYIDLMSPSFNQMVEWGRLQTNPSASNMQARLQMSDDEAKQLTSKLLMPQLKRALHSVKEAPLDMKYFLVTCRKWPLQDLEPLEEQGHLSLEEIDLIRRVYRTAWKSPIASNILGFCLEQPEYASRGCNAIAQALGHSVSSMNSGPLSEKSITDTITAAKLATQFRNPTYPPSRSERLNRLGKAQRDYEALPKHIRGLYSKYWIEHRCIKSILNWRTAGNLELEAINADQEMHAASNADADKSQTKLSQDYNQHAAVTKDEPELAATGPSNEPSKQSSTKAKPTERPTS